MGYLDALYDAAISGDADARAKLEMEIDKLHRYRETLLHIESESGNTERVQFILREFANKNLLAKLSSYEKTALHLAIDGGHTEVAEVLIEAARQQMPETSFQAFLMQCSTFVLTSLHLAVEKGNVAVVKLLLDAARQHLPEISFQDFLRQGDIKRETALHAAVMCGHLAIVKLLVEADPTDPHQKNREGKTPIFIAVEKGLNDIVEIISTTCTAPSLDGPDWSTAVRINNLDQVESPGGALYKIMDRDAWYAAAIAGDADAIAKLEMEADILNEDCETILLIESRNGNTEGVQYILRVFAEKNFLLKFSRQKETALHLAIDNGHTRVAEVIIEAVRPLDYFLPFLRLADNYKETALHLAVKKGNVEIVKLLVEADPTHTHQKNGRDKTPMYIAVEKGLNDIVEIFSSTCAAPSLDGPDRSTAVRINNLDQVKSSGGTLYKIMDRDALYAAAIAGDADAIAKLKIEADILGRTGRTILHVESENGKAERVQFLLREFADKNLLEKLTEYKQTALYYAIHFGHTEVAKVIIEAARGQLSETSFRAFLRKADSHMDTALHLAVRQGKVAVVKLLVEADTMYIAELAGYNNEQTVLHLAIEGGHTELALFITDAAKRHFPQTSFQDFLRQEDNNKATALHLALERENVAVVKLLVEADLTYRYAQNSQGKTPIYIALEKGYTDIVKVICTAPVNLDGPGGKHTALHVAVKNSNLEVVRLLIDAAARWPSSASDNDNTESFQAFLRRVDEELNTALHIAVMQDKLATAELLVAADPSCPGIHNNKGETPFYIAAEKGYAGVLKMMCVTSTAPLNLKGPGGRMTALHAVIKNLDEGKNEIRDVIKVIFDVIKDQTSREELFRIIDEDGQTILETAVERNNVTAVELLLDIQLSALSYWSGRDVMSLMPLIYKAENKGHKNMVKILGERYQDGAEAAPRFSNYFPRWNGLIAGIRRGQTETVSSLLDDNVEALVTLADNLGWTALHHAAYHKFDSTIKPIVEALKRSGHFFQYKDAVPTPFHVAAERGNTSTLILLFECWPSSSSAYTAVDKNGQNILHLAAMQSQKEVIQDILKYCPQEHKNELVNKRDKDGNTPLHLLIKHGCWVPQLLRYEGLDIKVENNNKCTPRDMLYFENKIIDDQDQVKIKVSLDQIEIDRKMDFSSSSVFTTSERQRKDEEFKEKAQKMIEGKVALMKKDTQVVANCFAEVIAGDPISRAALMEANTSNEAGETILHVESKQGVMENIRFILSAFENKNLLGKLDNRKQTALHLAAHHGHTQVVEALLNAARRNLPSSSDNDDMHNSLGSFQDFIRQVNVPNQNTALHLAVLNGDVAIVKLLVEADPNDSHVPNNEGKTPIYIAAEKGCKDIVKEICTTCTTLSLDGPGGRTTALHIAVKNSNHDIEVVEVLLDAARRLLSSASDNDNTDVNGNPVSSFQAFLRRVDENRQTILELAVEQNYVKVIESILDGQTPASEDDWIGDDFISLMPLIYKAMDKEYKNIVKLLTQKYEAGAKLSKDPEIKDQASLISAIRRRESETVLSLLDGSRAQRLVTFVDNLGWTALHHATYHEFDSIIKTIVEALKTFGHEFVYQDMLSTPFHVAAERGYTSTVTLLMQLWPSSSSAYTSVDKYGQNILHLAALRSKKEMIHGILECCPKEYKKELVNKQDNDGNTPLHVLIRRGCLVVELLRYEGLDTKVENNNRYTPLDMLYVADQIMDDQVKIKVALDHIQNDRKRDIFLSSVFTSSERERKDVNFRKEAQEMIDGKLALIKENTRAVAKCYADAIAGDPISRAALEMEADTLNEAGETILHVESKKGVLENIQFILSAFANKNLLVKLDSQKQTALYLAAHHGHPQVVEALLKAASRNPVGSFQAYIRQANVPDQNTALHQAVFYNHVAIVKLIVHADPNDSHVKNYEGKTPIYIAAEKGYKDIVEEICRTCTALSLDGPGGRTTALHAPIQNIDQVTEGTSDVIGMMVVAAKRWSTSAEFEALFSRTDESESTVLQLAMKRNCVEAVRSIVQEDPAYQHGPETKRNGLLRLLYKAIDNKFSDDIVNLLSQTYKAEIDDLNHKDVVSLIVAMKRRDEESVLRLLGESRNLVTFTEDNGWTPLHYAVYHEFDSVLGAIIGAQEDVGHQFVCEDRVPTPFHVAVECGYTSTLVRLMQLWPVLSSASAADKSPYTVVNKDRRNILHLAAAYNSNTKADNRKEMVEGILKYCPKMYKDKILKEQDINGDTPLHLLISHGCFIPELVKDEGLDMAKNKDKFTPRQMLYFKNDVVADQVRIKIAIDRLQTNKLARNPWTKRTEKKNDIWEGIPDSKRRTKDVIFNENKKLLMDAEYQQKKKDLERYKMRTNTQIIVAALITTVTFTVGFTMPGGLHQSGEVDEGLVLLSKKKVFNAFMVSDALALLLSTSSLFLYFLESVNEDPHQVSKLNTASAVLNIISVLAMMLTFIAGTYLVLSHSPALAITVCSIGALFFLLIIILLIMIGYDRWYVKRD